MRFLICGLGSIGQRHYANLRKLGYEDIIVFRTGKGNKDFVEKFIDEWKPKIFTDLGEALKERPKATFITNPTSLHVSTAWEAAMAGCDLFIEKPLSSNLNKEVMELYLRVFSAKLVAYVGYNFRFHPLLLEIKNWIKQGLIGKVVSAHAEMCERVTGWHPWEDYRESYACRKELGGGVLLTQSHELDYLCWLFGPPKEVHGFAEKLSDLEMDADDVAKVIIKFYFGVIASVNLDYVQVPPRRKLEIIGTTGKIVCDYNAAQLNLYTNSPDAVPTRIISLPNGFERNDMYLDELKHFIDCVKNRKEPINDISQAFQVLKIAEAIKGGGSCQA